MTRHRGREVLRKNICFINFGNNIGFSSKKVWIFMSTMQNYYTRLPAPFIGDGYSSWLLYSKGNSKRETGTVEFHNLNLVGFWK